MPESDAPPPSERSLLVSIPCAGLKVVGSLFVTVAILVLLIAVLVWGTFVEKIYGDTAAKFGIYGAWWFNALGFLLGLNAAAALVLRWPWKLRQLGFIIPHIGLIVLLAGCFVSRECGIEATLSVFEGESSDLAYKGSEQHVELGGQQQFHLQVVPAGMFEKPGEPIIVLFTSGPFNWDDYRRLGPLPWSLAHRDRGLLFDRDGIRLEVLDYLSNSTIVNLPNLEVRATPLGPDGRELSEQAKAFTLSVRPGEGPHFSGLPYGRGSEETLTDDRRILFWMTGSAEETAAFRQSKPHGPLGRLGRVVLYAGGKTYDFPVSDWKPGTRRALGDSGLEAELVDADVEQFGVGATVMPVPRVNLKIHHGPTSHPLVLSAEFPEIFSRQDYDDKVFGSYWLAAAEKPAEGPKTKPDAAATFAPPRIDFLQGADGQLYLRTWRSGEVTVSGPLKLPSPSGRGAGGEGDLAAKDGHVVSNSPLPNPLPEGEGDHSPLPNPLPEGEGDEPIIAFRDTPDAVVLRLEGFQSAERPGFSARPVSFDKNLERTPLRQAHVRLTVDENGEEFWIPCFSFNPVEEKELAIPEELLRRSVAGRGRRVELSFVPESFHIGYSVDLHKAWRKLDPGTRQPSFYGSEIDLVPSRAVKSASAGSLAPAPPKYENLLVTLNAPLDFADPAFPGRSYRMFQSTMPGPFSPEKYGLKPGEPVYLSGFRLNYDPGRGLTYVGCLLIVAGIFVAYFVRFAGPGRNPLRVAETMLEDGGEL